MFPEEKSPEGLQLFILEKNKIKIEALSIRMKKIVFILVIIVSASTLKAQQLKNLYDFDEHLFHFGFVLGYNQADFHLDHNPNFGFEEDSLLSLEVNAKSGFNLGIVSSLNMHPNVHLRFVPTLSFQERWLEYTYLKANDTTEFWNKKVESVFVDFPLLFKLRTNRINNFAAYLLGGGRFSVDMANNRDVKNSTAALEEQIVKLSRTDIAYEVGAGFDFFLEYFKFGIELKMGAGMKNILIQENLKFSSPIEQLRSKMWTLSFTFEG